MMAEMEGDVNGRGNVGMAVVVLATVAVDKISYDKIGFLATPSLLLAPWIQQASMLTPANKTMSAAQKSTKSYVL
jgi:hypothetical protein